MSLLDDFIGAFEPMPNMAISYLRPYIRKMISEQEIQLVVTMKKAGGNPMSTGEIANLMTMPVEEASKLLERSTARGILSKKAVKGETLYKATSFYNFAREFATYNKKWDELPIHVRNIFSEWIRRVIYNKHHARVEKVKQGELIIINDILPLKEVLEIVEAAHDFAVIQCGCRRLYSNCDFPTEACFRFNEKAKVVVEQGRGRRLTKDETKNLIIQLNRKGLIHLSPRPSDIPVGSTGDRDTLCSCCACCCNPIKSSIEIGKSVWPGLKSHYIAAFDPEKCSYCGLCVKRCQFGAWEHDGTTVEVKGQPMKRVALNIDMCWGCGLCANTCPTKAIIMKPLKSSPGELFPFQKPP